MTLPKLSTAAVMLHIAGQSAGRNYALAICQDTGYPSGTVVPALRRLAERDGLLTRSDEPTTTGRPRVVYALTPDGRAYVDELLSLLESIVLPLKQAGPSEQLIREKVNLSSLIVLASALRNGGSTFGYSEEMRPLTHQAAYAEIARMRELGWCSAHTGELTAAGRSAAAALGTHWAGVISRARR